MGGLRVFNSKDAVTYLAQLVGTYFVRVKLNNPIPNPNLLAGSFQFYLPASIIFNISF
jgi:hypothetical protein